MRTQTTYDICEFVKQNFEHSKPTEQWTVANRFADDLNDDSVANEQKEQITFFEQST